LLSKTSTIVNIHKTGILDIPARNPPG